MRKLFITLSVLLVTNITWAQENAPSPSDDLNWVSSIRYDFGWTQPSLKVSTTLTL